MRSVIISAVCDGPTIASLAARAQPIDLTEADPTADERMDPSQIQAPAPFVGCDPQTAGYVRRRRSGGTPSARMAQRLMARHDALKELGQPVGPIVRARVVRLVAAATSALARTAKADTVGLLLRRSSLYRSLVRLTSFHGAADIIADHAAIRPRWAAAGMPLPPTAMLALVT